MNFATHEPSDGGAFLGTQRTDLLSKLDRIADQQSHVLDKLAMLKSDVADAVRLEIKDLLIDFNRTNDKDNLTSERKERSESKTSTARYAEEEKKEEEEDEEWDPSEDDLDAKKLVWPANITRRKNMTDLPNTKLLLKSKTYTRATFRRESSVRASLSSASQSIDGSSLKGDTEEPAMYYRCLSAMVFLPDSACAITMEVFSTLALLSFDFCILPYRLAWRETPLIELGLLVTSFWLVDMIMNFFTAHYHDGELVRDLRKLALEYVRRTFIFDCTAIVLEYIFVIAAFSVDGQLPIWLYGTGLAARAFGLCRAVKLIRLADRIIDSGLSDLWRNSCLGIQLILSLLVLNHLVTCGWYAIGKFGYTDTGGRWLDTMRYDVLSDDEFNYKQDIYEYSTAFHWALSQILSGGVEMIGALNSLERGFSILSLLFGLIIVSSLVSLLSAALMQVKMEQQEQTDKIVILRQYLSQYGVNSSMASSVQRQVKARMQRKKNIRETDVVCLSLLSEHLRTELRYTTIGPKLLEYPLLRTCQQMSEVNVKQACFKAVSERFLGSGDALFQPGQDASGAYYLTRGTLTYSVRRNTGPLDKDITQKVSKGTLFVEAGLWCEWQHVGAAMSNGMCSALHIDAAECMKALERSPDLQIVVPAYAASFHNRLISASPPNSDWPTDIAVPFTDYGEMVLSMDKEVRRMIGLAGLSHTKRSFFKSAHILEKLEAEVESGDCVLIPVNDHVERVVAIAALSLTRNDEILIELGKVKPGDVVDPVGMLPALKQKDQETPSQAAYRLVKDMSSFAGKINIEEAERQVEWMVSPTFHMRSRYLKTIHHAVQAKHDDFTQPSPLEVKHNLQAAARQKGSTTSGLGAIQSESSKQKVIPTDDQLETIERLVERSEVFFAMMNKKPMLYGWLKSEDYELLAHSDSKFICGEWLKMYDLYSSPEYEAHLNNDNPGAVAVSKRTSEEALAMRSSMNLPTKRAAPDSAPGAPPLLGEMLGIVPPDANEPYNHPAIRESIIPVENVVNLPSLVGHES